MNIREYVSTTELELEENTSFPHVGVLADTQNKWTKLLSLESVIYCSVILIGVVLNMVVIIVYARKLQKSTNIFLLCLAVSDVINCLNISLDILKNVIVLPESTRRAVCIAYPYIVDTGCLISAGLVVCIAIDRYIRSKYLKNSLSRTQSFTLVIGVVISSLIVTSPLLLVRTAKLMSLNQQERDHMCGELYSNHHLHYSESSEIKFSNPMLFLLVLDIVILFVLSLAAVTITVIYLKMSLELWKKSFSRRSKVSSEPQISEKIRYEMKTFREVKFDEASINSSQISSDGFEELRENTPAKLTPKVDAVTNDNNKKESPDNIVIRRKSRLSIFSTGKQFPSKIITPRYYCLIFSSILLFLFYLIHFLLHIINICQQDYRNQGYMRHILFKCLDHLYILCFVLNPVIYSFFNRGFFRNFKRVFCCDNTPLHDSRRSSVESSFR